LILPDGPQSTKIATRCSQSRVQPMPKSAMPHPIHRAITSLEAATGLVIPVYFGPAADPAAATALLGSTVQMFVREVGAPQRIVLSVDGPGPAEAVARAVATQFNVQWIVGPVNRGKLGALLLGMQTLLADTQIEWCATVDQDGDHFGNELLNFVRAGQQVQTESGEEAVLVLGNRRSRARPLGFLRAEQETLCNLMLLDALTYHAAVTGRPLAQEYLTPHTPLPDFHSGYKLLSRSAAHAVFNQPPPLLGLDERAALRHAVEAVITVEAHLAGARLAAVARTTYDEQPISLFADLNRARLAADMILWPCLRLGVPAEFVAAWLANHLPALTLGSLLPQGQEELRAIRDWVLVAYGLDPAAFPATWARPRFL
jgi:hypothetical protein